MDFTHKLVLADGTVFFGNGFGAPGEVIREVVFQTARADYLEVLTDTDNYNQMVVMPHIHSTPPPPIPGNYKGASALITGAHCPHLDQFLKDSHIPGLWDIDTQALIEKIRTDGVMYGIIVAANITDDQALVKLTQAPYVTNHVKQVSPKKAYTVHVDNPKGRIALVAFTAKRGIINELVARDYEVVVLPYNTPAHVVDTYAPDGVVFSSGPGDPLDLPETTPVIQALQERYPLFGVCLGHQLFAIANGATTCKMKYGHRGEAIEIMDIATGKTLTTVQNHGYHVDPESIQGTPLEVTQYALADHSIEGLKHQYHPAFTAQYHPESNTPGQDTNYLFDQFIAMVDAYQNRVKLRPHHLLCTQGYEGKGYSQAFVDNMTRITQYLRHSPYAMVEIVQSTDDICAHCPKMLGQGLCQSDEKVLRYDQKVVDYFGVKPCVYVYKDLVATINQQMTQAMMDDICGDCGWYDTSLCRERVLGG